MKLKRITLRNIYGHAFTDVDLCDVAAAVVTGDNGAGKSSLICDAPLFALFGRPAIRGNTYADVVKTGADEGCAIVEFEIGGEVYRVARTYSMKTKAGSSSLELTRHNGVGWDPVEDGRISDVEAAITDLLGVDYSTFTTGSFMRQDEAGRFAQATSTERIEMLSGILGIDYLREAFTATGRKQSENDGTLVTLNKRLDQLDHVDAELADLEEQLDALTSEKRALDEADAPNVDALKGKRDRLVERRDTLREQVAGFDTVRNQVDALSERIESTNQDLAHDREILAAKKSKLDRLKDCANVEQFNGYETVDAARAAGERLREQNDRAEQDERRLVDLTASVERLESRREVKREERDNLDDQCVALSDDLDAMIADAWSECDDFKAEAEGLREQIKAKRERFRELRLTIEYEKAACRDQNRTVEARQDSVDRLERRAKAIESRPDAVAIETCKPCGLLVDAFEAREQIKGKVAELEQEQKLLAKYEQRLEDAEQAADDEGLASHEDLDKLVAEYERAAGELDTIVAHQTRLDEFLEKYGAVQTELEDLADKIAKARADRDQIREAYDLDDNQQPTSTVSGDLDDAREAYRQLVERDKARDEFEEVAKSLGALDSKVARLEQTVEDLKAKRAELREQLVEADKVRESLDEVSDEVDQVYANIEKAREQSEQLAKKRASLDKQIARLDARHEGLQEQADEIQQIRDDITVERLRKAILAHARDFFRAAPQLVIGSAIPRLETEANDVLREIFPGARVRVYRQRDTKDGGRRDELHLEVSKGSESRAFDTFSGGEKFRVNLALRLGLARAAAGRDTGRPIEVLVVDEGFGSLDDEGKQAAKDALLRLTQRFRQILVITHVDDLYDTFDQKIEVVDLGNSKQVKVI